MDILNVGLSEEISTNYLFKNKFLFKSTILNYHYPAIPKSTLSFELIINLIFNFMIDFNLEDISPLQSQYLIYYKININNLLNLLNSSISSKNYDNYANFGQNGLYYLLRLKQINHWHKILYNPYFNPKLIINAATINKQDLYHNTLLMSIKDYELLFHTLQKYANIVDLSLRNDMNYDFLTVLIENLNQTDNKTILQNLKVIENLFNFLLTLPGINPNYISADDTTILEIIYNSYALTIEIMDLYKIIITKLIKNHHLDINMTNGEDKNIFDSYHEMADYDFLIAQGGQFRTNAKGENILTDLFAKLLENNYEYINNIYRTELYYKNLIIIIDYFLKNEDINRQYKGGMTLIMFAVSTLYIPAIGTIFDASLHYSPSLSLVPFDAPLSTNANINQILASLKSSRKISPSINLNLLDDEKRNLISYVFYQPLDQYSSYQYYKVIELIFRTNLLNGPIPLQVAKDFLNLSKTYHHKISKFILLFAENHPEFNAPMLDSPDTIMAYFIKNIRSVIKNQYYDQYLENILTDIINLDVNTVHNGYNLSHLLILNNYNLANIRDMEKKILVNVETINKNSVAMLAVLKNDVNNFRFLLFDAVINIKWNLKNVEGKTLKDLVDNSNNEEIVRLYYMKIEEEERKMDKERGKIYYD